MAGTIRKRTWVTRKGETKTAWLADYFDQKRKRHTKQFPTKKAADAWLLRARGEVRDGVHTPDSASITVAEAGALFLQRCALDGLERGTQRFYEQVIRLCIDPLLGGSKLARLSSPEVEEFRDALLGRFSYYRAGKALGLLKTVIGHAQRRGLVAQNVARLVRITDRPRRRERLAVGRTIPLPEEVRTMLAVATGGPRVMLLVAAFTGLRVSELRGLEWQDVDLAAATLTVRQRADHWGALGRPKSKAGQRTVPLAAHVVATLREWWMALGRPPASTLVFPGQSARMPLSAGVPLERFYGIQRDAGILDGNGAPKYVFHALRHFFASVMIGLGYTSKWLQVAMGHETIMLTLDTYGHLFPDPDGDQAKVAAFEAVVLGIQG
jgi:integrase